MKISLIISAIAATLVASTVGLTAQGGTAATAAARLATPAPTGSMGALTKAASSVRSSRAAALAGKGLTAGSGESLGRSTQIMGYLWTSNNGAMTNANVQIRNTVTNVVERVATTNAAGEFVFQNITPGEYVIEYVQGSVAKIVAIGHPFTVSPGETVATFVRLSNGLPMLIPNELSNLTSNVAAQAVTSAAAQGVSVVTTPLVSVVPTVPLPGVFTPPPAASPIR